MPPGERAVAHRFPPCTLAERGTAERMKRECLGFRLIRFVCVCVMKQAFSSARAAIFFEECETLVIFSCCASAALLYKEVCE